MSPPNPNPRVVLVHDWLTGMRGGEKCLEPLCERWPHARLFTLLHRRGSVSSTIERLAPRVSPLGRLPAVHRYYRYLLPLMPLVVDRWKLPPCDLVVSFSHCVAKGVRPPKRFKDTGPDGHEGRDGRDGRHGRDGRDGHDQPVPHVCYCFTPVRYAWHLRDSYFHSVGFRGLKARMIDAILHRLREWDLRTSSRVSHFLAISRTVQTRIRECYGRDSVVISPPVDTEFYTPLPGSRAPRDNYYLVVSAFAPYKRLDLAIQACNQLGRTLLIIGAGQEEARLRALAGSGVHFLGWRSDAEIRQHLRRCRALLFPGEEDFGIVPVEAMACGTPVVAYGCGGATETIVPLGVPQASSTTTTSPTGVWFEEQTVQCLLDALQRFESAEEVFEPSQLRRQALRFTAMRFREQFFHFLDDVLQPNRTISQAA